jgi:hypothetical protein
MQDNAYLATKLAGAQMACIPPNDGFIAGEVWQAIATLNISTIAPPQATAARTKLSAISWRVCCFEYARQRAEPRPF